jgi:hypothetical protein
MYGTVHRALINRYTHISYTVQYCSIATVYVGPSPLPASLWLTFYELQ